MTIASPRGRVEINRSRWAANDKLKFMALGLVKLRSDGELVCTNLVGGITIFGEALSAPTTISLTFFWSSLSLVPRGGARMREAAIESEMSVAGIFSWTSSYAVRREPWYVRTGFERINMLKGVTQMQRTNDSKSRAVSRGGQRTSVANRHNGKLSWVEGRDPVSAVLTNGGIIGNVVSQHFAQQ